MVSTLTQLNNVFSYLLLVTLSEKKILKHREKINLENFVDYFVSGGRQKQNLKSYNESKYLIEKPYIVVKISLPTPSSKGILTFIAEKKR